jgi:hypothetical protein
VSRRAIAREGIAQKHETRPEGGPHVGTRAGDLAAVASARFPTSAMASKLEIVISGNAEALCRFPAAPGGSTGDLTMLNFTNRPNHLWPRREKIFGPAPEHRLDGNAKARVWAAAGAYNAQNRQEGQHQGPLTWATLRVLRALLWRFHGADGGGRCFPSYEKLAAAARCARSSVAVALRALENAGLLTWVHRIARVRRQERDLFGRLIRVWQVIRISNGYCFGDPLDRAPGRKGCKSENPTRPQNLD